MARNPPANAGDTGMIPGLGRFHMPWGNSATATEPVCCIYWSPHTDSLSSTTREVTAMRSPRTSSWRLVPTHCNKRKPACSNEDAVQAKQKFKKHMMKINTHTQKQNMFLCHWFLADFNPGASPDVLIRAPKLTTAILPESHHAVTEAETTKTSPQSNLVT